MKPWQDPRFYIRVRQGDRWRWLHCPPMTSRISLTPDKRVAATVRAECYAEVLMEQWAKQGGTWDEWQCMGGHDDDADQVYVSGGRSGGDIAEC